VLLAQQHLILQQQEVMLIKLNFFAGTTIQVIYSASSVAEKKVGLVKGL
jgi:hypothetical protein